MRVERYLTRNIPMITHKEKRIFCKFCKFAKNVQIFLQICKNSNSSASTLPSSKQAYPNDRHNKTNQTRPHSRCSDDMMRVKRALIVNCWKNCRSPHFDTAFFCLCSRNAAQKPVTGNFADKTRRARVRMRSAVNFSA